MTQNLREVEKALTEMKKKKVINHWKIQKKIHDPHNKRKITNIILLIYPHHDFVKQMKKANKLQSDTIEKAAQLNEENRNKPLTMDDIEPFRRN